MANPPRIFIGYAHTDNDSPDPSKRWLDRLLEMLGPLQLQGLAKAWSDHDIDLGEAWHRTIQDTLDQVVAAVLLISPAFLNSKYIRNSEVPVLLKHAQERGVKILPIIIKHSLYEETTFKYPDPVHGPEELSLASIQAANPISKPLTSMTEDEQDKTLLKVARKLKEIVENPTLALSTKQDETNLTGDFAQAIVPQPTSQPSPQVRWQIVLDGELFSMDEARLVDGIVSQLAKISGDADAEGKARDSIDGSVVLKLKGTEAGFRVVKSLYQSGNLREISGWPVEAVELPNNPSGRTPLPSNLQQRLRFTQRLAEIPGPQFEQLLFALQVPKGIVAGSSSPQGQRVASLLEWAESQGGCGIDSLEALLDDLINPR
ncbi:MAG: toll/interleukin-1 receptor domain-containing protein [Leptolyngbyaceae cyanobacterium SM2_5_2]|nr:toll/interleukin-1 receptor domain-containing protein [Leptolyngbyaceae cyanobacterium SM2_5_2]